MSAKEKRLKQLQESFVKLHENEIQFSIVTCLAWYGSLNLRQISHLIGKPEPTTYRYARQLLDEGLIILDNEMSTAKRGKYYVLSPDLRNIATEDSEKYEDIEEDSVKRIKEIREKINQGKINEIRKQIIDRFLGKIDDASIINGFKHSNSLTSNIQNSIINSIVFHGKQLKKKEGFEGKDIKDSDVLRTHAMMNMYQIKTWKTEHLVRLYEIVYDYFKKLKELTIDLRKELEKEKVPEEDIVIQYISSFGGYIDTKYLEDK